MRAFVLAVAFLLVPVRTVDAQRSDAEIIKEAHGVCRDGLLEARKITAGNLARMESAMAECANHMPPERCRAALKVTAKLGLECRTASDRIVADGLRDLSMVDRYGSAQDAVDRMAAIAKNSIKLLEDVWDKYRLQVQGIAALKLQEAEDQKQRR